MLEDLTRGFHRPNVIDFKIGTQTFDPFAPEAKRKKEMAKYCMMKDLGFCVTDYRQYDPGSKAFRYVDDVLAFANSRQTKFCCMAGNVNVN